jgi:hypothetical protein
MRFLALPQITVRRMMVYVVVIALAIQAAITLPPAIDSAREHWAVCTMSAAEHRKAAADCRELAVRYPGDTIIWPDVGHVTRKGQFVPYTGGMAGKDAPYHEASARIYESARWRPWAGMPTQTELPSPPPLPGL